MMDFMVRGGPMMWPLLLVAVGVLVQAGRLFAAMRRSRVSRGGARRRMNTMLFWGGIGLVLGALGTVVGLVDIAQSVRQAGNVSSGLLAAGIGLTLPPLVLGLVLFLAAAILWLVLDLWVERVAEAGGAEGVGA